MARGKYAVRAENRNWDALEKDLVKTREALEMKSKALHDMQKEVLRLRALESIFDGTRDVIAELESVRAERDDLQNRNFVMVERLNSWARILMDEQNRGLLKLNSDLAADLVSLGYWPDDLKPTRTHRRNTLTGAKTRKTLNIAKAMEVGGN